MRILLSGKNGQVGFELQRALAPLAEVVAVGRDECDLASPEAIRRLVREVQPEVIVNPAAYTAVDRAESEPELARAINTVAPEILAQEAERLDALVVHYCTDYVYDGDKAGWYTERDPANPQNVYGATKLAGTEALLRISRKCLVFRTSWVVGSHGANFAKTMLRLATEREQLNIVADQFGAPTSAALIADCTAQVLGRFLWNPDESFPFGLYHLTASGETTWCDYARTVIETARRAGKKLTLPPNGIRPIATAEYPLPARRPANSRLSTGKLQQRFGLHPPHWREGLNHILQHILE